MNELLPIIRRVRRPLVQENAETLKPETLKPLVSEPVPPANVELGNIEHPTSNIEHPMAESVPGVVPVETSTKRKKSRDDIAQN